MTDYKHCTFCVTGLLCYSSYGCFWRISCWKLLKLELIASVIKSNFKIHFLTKNLHFSGWPHSQHDYAIFFIRIAPQDPPGGIFKDFHKICYCFGFALSFVVWGTYFIYQFLSVVSFIIFLFPWDVLCLIIFTYLVIGLLDPNKNKYC